MRTLLLNTYNALDPITDTITVVVLMTTITIMMMMMKDWMAKCDISGQLGSVPPGRACSQKQIVHHSSMKCHHTTTIITITIKTISVIDN